MKFCCGVLLFMAMGCATSGPKAPEQIADVKVGDKLSVTIEGFTDCVMDVKNIITAQPTPMGFLEMNPTICGTLTCKKSMPEAADGAPACMRLDAFQPPVKPKAKTK